MYEISNNITSAPRITSGHHIHGASGYGIRRRQKNYDSCCQGKAPSRHSIGNHRTAHVLDSLKYYAESWQGIVVDSCIRSHMHTPLSDIQHHSYAEQHTESVGRSKMETIMNKHVLIIVENLPVPFDRRVWKEACALHEAGYQVTVLCPRAKGYTDRHVTLNDINIYRYPMSSEGNGLISYVWEYGWALFWQLTYAWWIYITIGFDIIQGCNPPDNIFLVALPFRLFGVKYIFDHHDASPELYQAKCKRNGLMYLLLLLLEQLTYSFSNAVIVTNESYKELAIKRGRVDSDAVFVVRNGPDLATIKPVPPNLALKYGKPHLVGYVGTMSYQEGLDILVEVVQQIRNSRRSDVHFTCVGGGPALPALRQLAKDRGVEDMINFTGRVSDHELLEVLSTADVCVNPDKPCKMNDMSTMIKIMEYMALGKPIVQFDLREGRFTAQEASLYANTEDSVTDFASKVLWLLDHPEHRQQMSDFAIKRVEQELAWKYSIANLLLAYKYVNSQGSRKREGQLAAGA